MAQDYYSLVTAAGRAKEALGLADPANQVELTHIALGDGDRWPTGAEVSLLSEQWRGEIATRAIDPNDPTAVQLTVLVPAGAGDFIIREAAVIDADGDLFAIVRGRPVPVSPATSGFAAGGLYRVWIKLAEAASVVVRVNPDILFMTEADYDARWATDAEAGNPASEHKMLDPKRLWGVLQAGGLPYASSDHVHDYVPLARTIATSWGLAGGGPLDGDLDLSVDLPALDERYLSGAGQVAGPGDVKWTASTTLPSGWLRCNGAAINREAYPELFAAIGTTYGAGDGATTFNLPDSRGRFLRDLDDGAGLDSGRTLGSAQADAAISHTHAATFTAGYYLVGPKGAGYQNLILSTGIAEDSATNYALRPNGVSAAAQSGGAAETRPVNLALQLVIKY